MGVELGMIKEQGRISKGLLQGCMRDAKKQKMVAGFGVVNFVLSIRHI